MPPPSIFSPAKLFSTHTQCRNMRGGVVMWKTVLAKLRHGVMQWWFCSGKGTQQRQAECVCVLAGACGYFHCYKAEGQGISGIAQLGCGGGAGASSLRRSKSWSQGGCPGPEPPSRREAAGLGSVVLPHWLLRLVPRTPWWTAAGVALAFSGKNGSPRARPRGSELKKSMLVIWWSDCLFRFGF